MALLEKLPHLSQFTGTESYYNYPLCKGLLYTDGVQYVANTHGAYWLIDVCMSHIAELIKKYGPDAETTRFMICKLRVGDGNAAFTIEDDEKNVLATQQIDFTDFPAQEIDFWFTDGVLLLPSEY